jgi:NAD(P)-dependent dehydrogenase (short-subunit alcohol dehydrogenase family)
MSKDRKVARITGVNRGIGLETARQLGQKNVTVVVGARNLPSAEEAAETLKAEGIEAYPVVLDVNKEADRKAAAAYVTDKFGKLDILINNAGIGGDGGLLNAHTITTSEEELHRGCSRPIFSW